MTLTLKHGVAAIFLILSFAVPVAAGPLEDAAAAFGRGDYVTALRLYGPLAEQGNDHAQSYLGLAYALGQGVRQDYAEAVKWWRRAANQGDADAQFNLGAMYANGQGVPQDYTESAKWYRKAADKGNASARITLGGMYYHGQGVPQSYAEAIKWFRKAADQGNADAQIILGAMYANGQGVPQSYAEAMKWFRKAADQGNADAQKYLDAVAGIASKADAFNKANSATPATAVDRCPTIPSPPASAVYSPEHEQNALRSADAIKDPESRMRVKEYLRQNYANDRMMSEINAKAAVGEYLHAIRQIRDDPKASRQVKEQCVKKLIDTMWNDPRLKYGDTAGDLEKSMQTLAGVTSQGSRSPRKPESEATSGTAFFVSKEGTAVTNAHVVERCQQIHVSINGQQGTARVVASDEKNDLALLATDLKPIKSANWRLSVRQGEDIVAYGFPLTGVLASGGNVVVGNVTALAGLDNDSRYLQISAPVQPGNSGGPLLDRAGNVVGIVVAKLNAIGIASVTGDIPQNVNFAIKASVAAAFLDAQRVVHAQGQDTASLSTPDLSERAKAFTAQVVCVR